MKKLILFAVLLVSFFSFSQEKYEYVIVPSKFDFLKDANQYNLNSLMKSFFETEGFTVYFDTDELPEHLANNRCKAFFADAIESNKLFTTNVVIQIKDCQNKVLLESFKGSSREKSLNVAYNEVFRFALTSLKGQLNFKNKKGSVDEVTITDTNEKVNVISLPTEIKDSSKDLLYALPIENGYKIVDSEPKVIYIIQSTSMDDVFIGKKGEIQGTFLKKINGWYFDYYKEGKLISEKVSVKF